MPHKRIDIEQDDIALRCLSGSEFKILQALVNRADERGVAFPGNSYICQATRYIKRTVERGLAVLEANLVIQYHRKDEWDNLTRRQLPNVMQINPDYISLSQGFELEARELWEALIKKCGNDSVGLWSHSITNASKPMPEPTPVDQRQLTSTKHQRPSNAEGRGQAADYANLPKKDQGKNADGETSQRAARNNQRNAPGSKSSVAPERPQYANPESINSNLPDAAHEALAAQIRKYDIAMPLARGFVVEYGYSRVKKAFDQVEKMGGKAREPAAVFRSIVQVRLAQDFDQAQQQIFNNRKQS